MAPTSRYDTFAVRGKISSLLLISLTVFLCAAIPLYAQEKATRLRLATTTSTEQSGLLSVLIPAFEKKSGLTVDVIAVGTGAALKLGEKGDADVLLVHARAQEDAFMAAGFGDERRDVFYNDFIILGPRNDPAKIGASTGGTQAFAKLASAQIPFVSRGDQSGTHVKEKELWKAAGIAPAGAWYKEAGQGMSQTIMMADQMNGYVLADRATWLAMKQKISLDVVCQGDKALFNPYGVISVSKTRYPKINAAGAKAMLEWLTGAEARKLVTDFKIGGESCFFLY